MLLHPFTLPEVLYLEYTNQEGKMRENPNKLYLKLLEQYRNNRGLSKKVLAVELGIPVGTIANWYRENGKQAAPSPKYVEWIRKFILTRQILRPEAWIHNQGKRLLHRIGFGPSQNIMDFGSGKGDYSIILAGLAGNKGRVISVDKDRNVLAGLMGRVRGLGIENIKDLLVSEATGTRMDIPLPVGSLDAIWFSDVLHDGYFKEDDEKTKLLRSCYRILKKKGFIAVHPVHMEERRLKRVIHRIGFRLEKEFRDVLMFHGEEFHRASVFKYKK